MRRSLFHLVTLAVAGIALMTTMGLAAPPSRPLPRERERVSRFVRAAGRSTAGGGVVGHTGEAASRTTGAAPQSDSVTAGPPPHAASPMTEDGADGPEAVAVLAPPAAGPTSLRLTVIRLRRGTLPSRAGRAPPLPD